jgi:hypothetical protein
MLRLYSSAKAMDESSGLQALAVSCDDIINKGKLNVTSDYAFHGNVVLRRWR